MPAEAGAAPGTERPDPLAVVRTRQYLVLLVMVALLGVLSRRPRSASWRSSTSSSR